MGDIVLVEGDNRLDVQMERLPPALEFVEFAWDATPPFQAVSQHRFNAAFKNLRPWGFTFLAEIYVNGELFKTKPNVLARGNETAAIVEYDMIFDTEGTYTITVKALYDNLLLDEISSVVSVLPPAIVPVIDGEIYSLNARWEGELIWHGIRNTNSWPADKQMIVFVGIENTGNVSANYRVTGTRISGGVAVSIIPGATGQFEVPPFYTVSGTYIWKIYANPEGEEWWQQVDEVIFAVTLY